MIKLDVDWLKKNNACKGGIKFVIDNNMAGRTIKSWNGDYNRYMFWLAEGHKTIKHYDDQGNLVSETLPTRSTYTYTYDDYGNVISMTAPNGGAYTYTYDGRGNLLRETLSDGRTYTYAYTYGDQGNVISMTTPDGHTYTYAWTTPDQFLITEDGHTILTVNFISIKC